MEEILLYVFIALTIIILWLVLHYWYKIQSREFIQSFIDSQETITFLSTEENVTMVNKEGLKLLGFKSLNEFHASKVQLSDFFIEEKDCNECLDKYTFGKKWISSVHSKKMKNNQVVNKVKIFSKVDSLNHYFQLKVSQLKGTKEYILNFADISTIERQKHDLEKSADYDPLTKVYNRVKLSKMFDGLYFNTNKHNHALSIILFDIDKFKSINDTHGHNVGDKVLVELALLVNGLLRDSDIIARWGGEEFLIVLMDTSAENAKKLAERIRKEIEHYPFTHVNRVTCSFGVTQFDNSDKHVTFLERADKALYEAKENGRNRVVMKLKSAKNSKNT
jgi:diguanylate cyclase (GGDEF)-like protein